MVVPGCGRVGCSRGKSSLASHRATSACLSAEQALSRWYATAADTLLATSWFMLVPCIHFTLSNLTDSTSWCTLASYFEDDDSRPAQPPWLWIPTAWHIIHCQPYAQRLIQLECKLHLSLISIALQQRSCFVHIHTWLLAAVEALDSVRATWQAASALRNRPWLALAASRGAAQFWKRMAPSFNSTASPMYAATCIHARGLNAVQGTSKWCDQWHSV